jgi:hypothetical protein
MGSRGHLNIVGKRKIPSLLRIKPQPTSWSPLNLVTIRHLIIIIIIIQFNYLFLCASSTATGASYRVSTIKEHNTDMTGQIYIYIYI